MRAQRRRRRRMKQPPGALWCSYRRSRYGRVGVVGRVRNQIPAAAAGVTLPVSGRLTQIGVPLALTRVNSIRKRSVLVFDEGAAILFLSVYVLLVVTDAELRPAPGARLRMAGLSFPVHVHYDNGCRYCCYREYHGGGEQSEKCHLCPGQAKS